ncbi:hypothetical protein Tco_1165220 [Tanacetum coccineum]
MLTTPEEQEELIDYLAASNEAAKSICERASISQFYCRKTRGGRTGRLHKRRRAAPGTVDLVHGRIILRRRMRSRSDTPQDPEREWSSIRFEDF